MVLKDELHVHLYGCLTARQLWTLGRTLWPAREARLEWYAAAYAEEWGRRPDWRGYFLGEGDPAALKRDFEFLAPGTFAAFQACFNLAIALLPATKDDATVVTTVLRDHAASGLRYVEYRCPLPPHMPLADIGAYVAGQAKAASRIAREAGKGFEPRLAFSLSRDPELFDSQYRILKDVQRAVAEASEMIVAIDFCGVEEGFPPTSLTSQIERVQRDNAVEPEHALAILYHVGESFEDMSLKSAARWVYEAHALGVHRLGHALALGLDPQSMRTVRGLETTTESVAERRRHLAFLTHNAPRLRDLGFPVDEPTQRRELERLKDLPAGQRLTIRYDDAELDETLALQQALLHDLGYRGAIVECCPTSNNRIGRLGGVDRHPLPRFLKAGIQAVLSSDDPGIFGCDLASEEALVRASLGLADADIEKLARQAEASRSGRLAGRVRRAALND